MFNINRITRATSILERTAQAYTRSTSPYHKIVKTSNATYATIRDSVLNELNIDHFGAPAGTQMIKASYTKEGVELLRKYALMNLPYEVQLAVARAIGSYENQLEILAGCFGCKADATQSVQVSGLKLGTVELTKLGQTVVSYVDSDDEHAAAVAVVGITQFFPLLDELEMIGHVREVVEFLEAYISNEILYRPYTVMFNLAMLKESPLKQIHSESGLLQELKKEKRYRSLSTMAYYMAATVDFVDTDSYAQEDRISNARIGVYLIAMIIQGEIFVPASWLAAEPMIQTLRTCLTMKMMNLEDEDCWGDLGQGVVADVIRRYSNLIPEDEALAPTIDAKDEGPSDDPAVEKHITTFDSIRFGADITETLTFSTYIKAACEMINEYIDMRPVASLAKMFNVAHLAASNSPDQIHGLSITMKYDYPRVTQLYNARLFGSDAAILTAPRGSLELPELDLANIEYSMRTMLQNTEIEERPNIMERLIKYREDLADDKIACNGGFSMLNVLPGRPGILLTNLNLSTRSKGINFKSEIDGDASVPYLLTLVGAAYATEIHFKPGEPLRYIRRSEPSVPLRSTCGLLSSNSTANRYECESTDPIDMLIAPRLPDVVGGVVFRTSVEQLELGKYQDTHLSVKGYVTEDLDNQLEASSSFARPVAARFTRLPSVTQQATRLDRRTKDPKWLEKNYIEQCKDIKFPYFSYVPRVAGTALRDGDAEEITKQCRIASKILLGGENKYKELDRIDTRNIKTRDMLTEKELKELDSLNYADYMFVAKPQYRQIFAPLNAHAFFGDHEHLLFSSTDSFIGFEEEIKATLDTIEDAQTLFGTVGNYRASKLRFEFFRDLLGRYCATPNSVPVIINRPKEILGQYVSEYMFWSGLHMACYIYQRMGFISANTRERVILHANNLQDVEIMDLYQDAENKATRSIL